MIKETRGLEFKATVSNTFLKTVSAYANYGTGQIKFGINDEGQVIGIDNPKQTCLDIENRINDSISPQPNYSLSIDDDKIIILEVQEGMEKPYLYKGKAYKRNDTASIPVSRGELNRLTLIGVSSSYDEQPAMVDDLKFTQLRQELLEKTGIDQFNQDILKTLNLYSESSGYNHAAELLADENRFAGIDMVRFGQNENEIRKRKTINHVSILTQFHQSITEFRDYYEYEVIKGINREKRQSIPIEAFRETIANTLVHRTWDVAANIQVSMYENRLEVVSPGGLPFGISEAEYLKGYISVPRNPILANVFFRLNYIEMFGTGIKRIQAAYQDSLQQPQFFITENAIRVVLPVVDNQNLTADERLVLEQFTDENLSKRDLVALTGLSSSKINRLLKKLTEENLLIRVGAGRSTKYHH
ncbi:ATP-binding protein [uncultured Limosilactobacillus sp.]|uniref:ATP-binding protein n=1 Tax=uncultured Limosilactobacillus sp. TaxID=2837629 RepID=UPI0025FC0E4D|nr:ATP-binding protein [uncultured Limosilactobacillus sp.]